MMTTLDTAEVLKTRLSGTRGSASLLAESLTWMSSLYDDETGLLWSPAQRGERHMVRESIWYALGLVAREHAAPDANAYEADRIPRLVDRVLNAQWHAPGRIWHGTFRRAPEEPDPPDDAVIWRDYDPNWRQFIGTILVLLLRLEGRNRLSHLAHDMKDAIALCLQGEPEDRVPPTYTNIALMRAWLEIEMADELGETWRKRGLDYARQIAAGFHANQTFPEYNSPTYYGVNFYALGLWQHYSTSAELREMGEEITQALWRDITRYYHAGMKNLCGPWSRSYGMDMQDYVAALGLWIWTVAGQEAAPFPMASLRKGAPLNHDHDFSLGPVAAISATVPSNDVMERLYAFPGPAEFTQVISTSPLREAHAWLTESMMIGLETAAISFRGTSQYHPLTCHWLCGKTVNWFRLRFRGRLEGTILDGVIHLTLIPDDGVHDCVFETGPGRFSTDQQGWTADGLTIGVGTDLDVREGKSRLELRGLDGETTLVLTPRLKEEHSA